MSFSLTDPPCSQTEEPIAQSGQQFIEDSELVDALHNFTNDDWEGIGDLSNLGLPVAPPPPANHSQPSPVPIPEDPVTEPFFGFDMPNISLSEEEIMAALSGSEPPELLPCSTGESSPAPQLIDGVQSMPQELPQELPVSQIDDLSLAQPFWPSKQAQSMSNNAWYEPMYEPLLDTQFMTPAQPVGVPQPEYQPQDVYQLQPEYQPKAVHQYQPLFQPQAVYQLPPGYRTQDMYQLPPGYQPQAIYQHQAVFKHQTVSPPQPMCLPHSAYKTQSTSQSMSQSTSQSTGQSTSQPQPAPKTNPKPPTPKLAKQTFEFLEPTVPVGFVANPNNHSRWEIDSAGKRHYMNAPKAKRQRTCK